jgi:hypothetical protein
VHTNCWPENLKERDHSEDLDVDGRIILREPIANFVDSLRVGTLWRCGDGLVFVVLPLASDALLTTLHSLPENVLKTVCRKLQEDSGTGDVDLLIWLEKPRNVMGGCSNGDSHHPH